MAAKTFAGANGTGPFVQSFYSAAVENKPYAELVRRALAGDDAAGAKLADKPQFVCSGKVGVDDSDTDTVASEICDLVDSGVVFAANTVRKIRLKCYMNDDDNLYFEETEQYVYCSPAGNELLFGSQKLLAGGATLVTATTLTNQAFGLVHTENVMGTGTTATKQSAGFTIADSPDGLDDVAHPANRIMQVVGANLFDPAYTATDGQLMQYKPVDGDAAQTDNLQHIQADDGTSPQAPGSGAIMSLTAILWPPAHAEVVITSGQPSINVSLPDLSLGDRVTNWTVEVYVGDPVALQPIV